MNPITANCSISIDSSLCMQCILPYLLVVQRAGCQFVEFHRMRMWPKEQTTHPRSAKIMFQARVQYAYFIVWPSIIPVLLHDKMFRICQLASGVSARACHAAQARVNMMISCQSNIRNPSSWLSAQRPLSCSRAPICQAAKSSERPTPGNDPRLSSTEQSMADTDPKLKV